MITSLIKGLPHNKMILLRNSHKYQAPLVLLKMTRFAHQFSETYSLRKDGNTHIMPCTQLHTNSQNLGQCFREGNGTPLQHSCLENPMDGGAWWAAVHGVAKSRMTERLHFNFSLSCIGEGNGNPLQCSCLENPGDGGAWWAVVYGVAQSRHD